MWGLLFWDHSRIYCILSTGQRNRKGYFIYSNSLFFFVVLMVAVLLEANVYNPQTWNLLSIIWVLKPVLSVHYLLQLYISWDQPICFGRIFFYRVIYNWGTITILNVFVSVDDCELHFYGLLIYGKTWFNRNFIQMSNGKLLYISSRSLYYVIIVTTTSVLRDKSAD